MKQQQQLKDRGQAGMKRIRKKLSERKKERDSEEKGSALAGKFGRINSVLPQTSAVDMLPPLSYSCQWPCTAAHANDSQTHAEHLPCIHLRSSPVQVNVTLPISRCTCSGTGPPAYLRSAGLMLYRGNAVEFLRQALPGCTAGYTIKITVRYPVCLRCALSQRERTCWLLSFSYANSWQSKTIKQSPLISGN